MKYSFSWNGVSCRTKGIRLLSMPPIIRPEERVDHVVIPGRSGELTQTEGADIYNSYIQTIPIVVDNKTDAVAAELWLRGDGYVTFGTQDNRKQNARIINAVTFTKHSKNSNWYEAEVQFYCDPIKHQTSEEAIEVTTSGSTVTNPGDIVGYPKIEITGSGTVTVATGGRTLTIPECVSGWVIDSENEWILQNNIPQINVCSGAFPVFNVGDNAITFTGATKLTITPNWRYL